MCTLPIYTSKDILCCPRMEEWGIYGAWEKRCMNCEECVLLCAMPHVECPLNPLSSLPQTMQVQTVMNIFMNLIDGEQLIVSRCTSEQQDFLPLLIFALATCNIHHSFLNFVPFKRGLYFLLLLLMTFQYGTSDLFCSLVLRNSTETG